MELVISERRKIATAVFHRSESNAPESYSYPGLHPHCFSAITDVIVFSKTPLVEVCNVQL